MLVVLVVLFVIVVLVVLVVAEFTTHKPVAVDKAYPLLQPEHINDV